MHVPEMHKRFMKVYKQVYVPDGNMFPKKQPIWRAKIKHSDLKPPYTGPLPWTRRSKN